MPAVCAGSDVVQSACMSALHEFQFDILNPLAPDILNSIATSSIVIQQNKQALDRPWDHTSIYPEHPKGRQLRLHYKDCAQQAAPDYAIYQDNVALNDILPGREADVLQLAPKFLIGDILHT